MQWMHILFVIGAILSFNSVNAGGGAPIPSSPQRVRQGLATRGATQSSTFEVLSTFHGGMRARVCVTNDLDITCGWRLRIRFSGRVSDIDVFGSYSNLVHNTRRSVAIVENTESNKAQKENACHEFVAHFSGNQPTARARYVRACRDDKFTDIESIPEQNSELRHTTGHGGEMWSTLCILHTYKIECGWEMVVHVSRRVTNFQIWSAVVKSINFVRGRGVTEIVLKNLVSNQMQPMEACHGFHMTLNADNRSPSVTAKFSMVCDKEGGNRYVSTVAEANAALQPPLGANFREPSDDDYVLEKSNVWSTGMSGVFCLFHTIEINCGFEADIALTAPVKEFNVYTLGQIGVTQRNDGSAIYHFKNVEYNKVQPPNKACFDFLIQFDSEKKPDPSQIKGRFSRVCDGGRYFNRPNVPNDVKK